MQVWVWNVSHMFASPVQSPWPAHALPTSLNVRQYGCASQVAQVYADAQSVLAVHDLVQVPAVLAPLVAQYEYVVSLHGAVTVSHASPSPATVTQTLLSFLVWPAAQAQPAVVATSSDAQRLHPPGTATALLSQAQALAASTKCIAGPHR